MMSLFLVSGERTLGCQKAGNIRERNGTDPGPRVNRRPNWHRTDLIPCEQRSTKWNGTVPPLDQNSSDPV